MTDTNAYRQHPPTEAEIALAALADTRGLADDTDWEALYAESLQGDSGT